MAGCSDDEADAGLKKVGTGTKTPVGGEVVIFGSSCAVQSFYDS